VTHDPEVAKLATRQLRMIGGRLRIEPSVVDIHQNTF
jgi:predicted ABC-type transport system involved in lysophospholipase L1 biosynthesis ATPase subunit